MSDVLGTIASLLSKAEHAELMVMTAQYRINELESMLNANIEQSNTNERAKIVDYLKYHDPAGCWWKEIEAGEHLKLASNQIL